MQKGFSVPFLLLGILVVIGVIFSYVFYGKTSQKNYLMVSPNSKQETALKVYSNQELGFEFQYVEGVEVKIDSEEEFNRRGNGDFRKNFTGYIGYEPRKVLGAIAVLDETSSYEANPFIVWVFENPEQLEPKNWFEKYWFYPFLWGVFAEPSKSHIRPQNIATVSGQTTQSVVVSYQTGSPKYLYVSKNGMMYLFRVIGETGDKILSSFTFLQ